MQLEADPHETALRLPGLPDVSGAEVSGVAEIARHCCPSQCIRPPDSDETNVPKHELDEAHAIDVTEYWDGIDVGVWAAAVVVVVTCLRAVDGGEVVLEAGVEVDVLEVSCGTLDDDED